MASNQKRGFLYIYKAGNHHQRKKDEDNQGKKSNSSRSWLQRLTRTRNSSNAEKIVVEEGGFVEARNSTSCLELGGGGGGGGEGFVEGRKSVSCIETRTAASSPAVTVSKGVIFEERRKSVSQIEGDFGGGVEKVVVDEGRKSVSQIETLSSVTAYLQVKVLVSDMPSFMQVHAFRSARRTFDSLEQFSSKHIAHNIKKAQLSPHVHCIDSEFDKAYGPVWHCIVGSSFGSFVTHATGCFLYFSMENLYILLFKTKVKKTLGKV
ncbi:hypothetical protein AAHE18_01G242900 [Arachis hypogaea]